MYRAALSLSGVKSGFVKVEACWSLTPSVYVAWAPAGRARSGDEQRPGVQGVAWERSSSFVGRRADVHEAPDAGASCATG